MRRRRVALFLMILIVVAAGLDAIVGTTALAEPRAVIELFTSQGCSSCPAADRLLGELASDPSVVAMSLPIDYWDYLGWKDTLANPRHTARQRGYALMRGDREVYTPQVVVNGMVHVPGGDKSGIEHAVDETRRNPSTLSLPVALSVDEGNLTVTIPAAHNPGASGEVWLCALTKVIPVVIERGENNGRTVTYHNVVRRWIRLGDYKGLPQSFSVPTAEFEAADIDSVAVIVQGGSMENPKIMLGAAIAAIH